MADPRETVSFEGLDAEFQTFGIDNSTIVYDKTKAGGSASVGLAVSMSTDKVVKLAADGDGIVGRLVLVESDNFCNVQTEGGMSLPAGTGASLTLGKKIVGCLLIAAPGYIREVATGTAAELGVARGQIRDNDDTANVVVML